MTTLNYQPPETSPAYHTDLPLFALHAFLLPHLGNPVTVKAYRRTCLFVSVGARKVLKQGSARPNPREYYGMYQAEVLLAWPPL